MDNVLVVYELYTLADLRYLEKRSVTLRLILQLQGINLPQRIFRVRTTKDPELAGTRRLRSEQPLSVEYSEKINAGPFFPYLLSKLKNGL